MTTVHLLLDFVNWCISCAPGGTAAGGVAGAGGAAAASAAAVAGTSGGGDGAGSSGDGAGDSTPGDATPGDAAPGDSGSGASAPGSSAAGSPSGADSGPGADGDASGGPSGDGDSDGDGESGGDSEPDLAPSDPDNPQDHDGPVDVENTAPDGTTITEHEGDPNIHVQDPNGNLDEIRPDGSIANHMDPDGTTTYNHENGSSETYTPQPDGSMFKESSTDKYGDTTTYNHDGSYYVDRGPATGHTGQDYAADGTPGNEYEYNEDGTVKAMYSPDGTSTYYNSDGSRDVFTPRPDGESTGVTYDAGSDEAHPYHPSDYDPWARTYQDQTSADRVGDGQNPVGTMGEDGSVTYKNADGTTDVYKIGQHETTLPDGTKINYDSATGTTVVHDPNGSTQIISSDGTRTTALPNGAIFQQGNDGTHTISDPDDGTNVFSNDGSQISHTDPDGTVPDGTVKLGDQAGTTEGTRGTVLGTPPTE